MVDDLPITTNDGRNNNDDDFRLQPMIEQPESITLINVPQSLRDAPVFRQAAKHSRYQRNPHTSLYAIDSAVMRSVDIIDSPENMPVGSTSTLISPSSGPDDMPISTRDYGAIKSIQRFLRLFSYTTIVFVPLFVFARLVFLLCFSSEALGAKFPAFISYAFLVMSITVLGTAILIAMTEFFQILLDVQSDTLAESKSSYSNG